ncbi:MAG: ACT domain-containing protein [Sedimentisphaerales bacterium]|nr:ACT domain-containing protein [Sedimentisphaerales bacterium]
MTAGKKKQGSQIFIVTVTGKDRVGIIASIANIMANANINIIDVSQRIMADYFVMMMGCDIAGTDISLEEIQRRLDTAAKEMKLNITFQNETIFKMMHRV